jgi:predicted nucleic acid-binding protein
VKLIDTSAWIQALRPDGDSETKAQVTTLLEAGEAAWCAMVRLELWNGAQGEHERRVLQEMERTLPDLEMSAAVWKLAEELARTARKRGRTIPSTDLLIAACARHHEVEVEHRDAHFDELAKF